MAFISAPEEFSLKPTMIADMLRSDKCPASMGIFDKHGQPNLIAVFVLPEHQQAVTDFVAGLHKEAGYVSPIY